jgi:RNA polymerase sigma-70 factor (ECF subfamily)
VVSPAIVFVEHSGVDAGARPQLRLLQGMARTTDNPRTARQGDLALVARFTRGDPNAFSELFRLYQKGVVRLVARMLGRSGDVPDVVQEVFLHVFKSLPRFRGTSRLSTWIYRIGVNVTLMHRRSRRSRPVMIPEDAGPVPADTRPFPDEQAERNRRVAALDALMDQLSEKKRTVFILHELQGLSPIEIAAIVRAPVLTVRTRLFYARRELTALIRRAPRLRLLFPELASESLPEQPGTEQTASARRSLARATPALGGEIAPASRGPHRGES